ncbi:MAG: photosystem II protein PsbQ [Elainella sp. Prado103]|jgi:photosystem II protein PsbQ|nr:photosystem II protein PsbQ [Elainella sp. Prado103]
MARYRSILALILVMITTFLVSCGNPAPKIKGPLYSTTQLEQIQRYTEDVQVLRDQMLEIPPLVQQQKWVDVGSFIHGPLGELRVRMSRLARTLVPKEQEKALAAAKEVFEHLNAIDEAAQTRDTTKALSNYNEALRDFETFFGLIPS